MTPDEKATIAYVLVVSTSSRGIIARAVRQRGYVPDVARDVAEAVAHLGRQRYRAVIVDLDSSDVDCLELILNVRDFDPSVLVIVMASAWSAANMAAADAQPGTVLVAKSGNVSSVSNVLARLPLLNASMESTRA
jgi:ActR/RegA family two-component response regulator